jgi:hypothetical protein
MYCLAEIKEHYSKTKEEQKAYEKKNYSGIALCGVTADVVG